MEFSGALIAAIVVAVIVVWAVIHVFNRLVSLRNKVRDAWSDIDVQLALRHDLVPNLVNAVQGYMTHERETLTAVTQARSAAIQPGLDIATRAVVETALHGAVGNLFVAAERYPELKASTNFLMLQEQLTSTENRIAFARQHYNETVRQYNTLLAEFPWTLAAHTFGYTPETMFASTAEDRLIARVA